MQSVASFMRRAYKFSVAILLFALVTLISVPVGAQGVQDFVIESFDAKYTLTNEDPQGLLTITEQIELNYSAKNQGILRAIPNTYKGEDVQLRVVAVDRDGALEPYITYDENDNTVLRIGEPGVYITGEHTYTITYELENVITFYDEYDEFYWDINGDQWLQPFESVAVDLEIRASRYGELSSQCFTGNAQKSTQDCEVSEPSIGLKASTNRTLQPGETLTIVQAYEKGYFTPLPWAEQNKELLFAAPILLVLFLAVRSAAKTWRRFGKDYKQRAVAPFYSRPKDLSVMQASYVSKNSLSTKDISAALIDLAIRGYLKIIESKDGRKTKHTLELLKTVDPQLTADEKMLINAVFKSRTVGEQFVIEDQKHKLSSALMKLSKNVESTANRKGMYEIAPSAGSKYVLKQLLIIIAITVVSFFLIEVVTPIPFVFGIASSIAVIVYMSLMTKRSKAGVEVKEHIEGLKLYVSKAEKDRLAMHDAVAAPLSTRGNPPVYDRKFFEKLLPFAVAMGVEKSWAKAFADIYTEPPDWYQGTSRIITAHALANSVGSTVKATSQTFTSPSSSGGSGFSGGSAGGGGGGGGGGGW